MDTRLTPEQLQQIRVIYETCLGWWNSLESADQTEVRGGIFVGYKDQLDELNTITNKSYDAFLPHSRQEGNTQLPQDSVCKIADLRVQIGGLLGRLRMEYLPDTAPYYIKNSEAMVLNMNQQVSQEVVFNQTLVNVADRIDQLEVEYPDDSKEKTFLQRLKSAISNGATVARNLTALNGLVLTLASEIGLEINQLHTLLTHLGLS